MTFDFKFCIRVLRVGFESYETHAKREPLDDTAALSNDKPIDVGLK
jgi:hypothetical protein